MSFEATSFFVDARLEGVPDCRNLSVLRQATLSWSVDRLAALEASKTITLSADVDL
jgi:hypothetical protein